LEAGTNFPSAPDLIYALTAGRMVGHVLTPAMNSTLPIVFAEATLSAAPLLSMAIYALAGIVLAIVGYKLFDLCTPGDLHEEIVKNRNTAAAMIGAAIIVGVCVIVAASIMG
jgi:putative membrane protein